MFTRWPHDVHLQGPGREVVVVSDPCPNLMQVEYHWRVRFDNGDRPEAMIYPSVQKECGEPNELSLVESLRASIATRATVASRLGQFIVDTAVVTGRTTGIPPGGTVTFKLFGPDDHECSGSPLMTTANVELAGTPPTARSNIFRPTEAGEYHWIVQYSGDGNYVGEVTACGGPGGTSVVSKHVTEETMTVAEVGVPARHQPDATARGRVTFAEVVELLSLPGEVPDE